MFSFAEYSASIRNTALLVLWALKDVIVISSPFNNAS